MVQRVRQFLNFDDRARGPEELINEMFRDRIRAARSRKVIPAAARRHCTYQISYQVIYSTDHCYFPTRNLFFPFTFAFSLHGISPCTSFSIFLRKLLRKKAGEKEFHGTTRINFSCNSIVQRMSDVSRI